MTANLKSVVPVSVSVSRRGSRKLSHHLFPYDSIDEQPGEPVYCSAAAPNGLVAEGEVPALSYAEICKLFEQDGVSNLLVDASAADVDLPAAYDRVRICAWHNGRPVSRERWKLQETVSDGLHGAQLVSSRQTHIDHLQMVCEPGPAMVMAVGGRPTLYPMPAPVEVERRILPVMVGGHIPSTAYWGFFRTSQHRAAARLGWFLLDGLVSGAAVDPEELIVIGHYLMNYERPDSEVAGRVGELLRKSETADASILAWALELDGLVPVAEADRHKSFVRAVRALHLQGCLYTEVFREFLQRVADGNEAWRSARGMEDGDPPDLELELAWIRQLAMATYWRSEFLTFRGLDPEHPDAAANGENLADAAKKKCAWFGPDPGAGRL